MITLYLQAVLGIAVFVALAMPLSSNWRRISWKLVGVAVALQFVICALLLKVPLLYQALSYVNRAVDALAAATLKGTSFVYGYVGGASPPFTVTDPGAATTFAVQVLPLLWYWRVLPAVVKAINAVFERALGTRGPAGLAATANIFLGQVEAPLLVRPYIARMNRFELLVLMTAGMATIAGSVPAALSAASDTAKCASGDDAYGAARSRIIA